MTWAPDRLSRNAGDLGMLVDLMDQEKLTQIKTFSQTFTNNPNEKFLLMILCSQAKLENDHKGENVKRGLKAKCERGWRPTPAPLGYLDDRTGKKGQKVVHLDPIRAPIIREIFEKVAYQGYSGRKIMQWLEDNNIKTRTGRPIYVSIIYRMLKDSYYYGEFEYPAGSGVIYKGAHEPIINKDLFEKVQAQLTIVPRMRAGTHEFNFVKMFKCGACKSGITASEKFRKLKDGTVNKHIYYHCVRFHDMYCRQPYIKENDLIDQLAGLIDSVSINKLGARDKIEREIARQKYFAKEVLGESYDIQTEANEVNIKSYAKYILREGAREEKREILCNLKSEIFIKDGRIQLSDI